MTGTGEDKRMKETRVKTDILIMQNRTRAYKNVNNNKNYPFHNRKPLGVKKKRPSKDNFLFL
jgi:hypothetical protein